MVTTKHAFISRVIVINAPKHLTLSGTYLESGSYFVVVGLLIGGGTPRSVHIYKHWKLATASFLPVSPWKHKAMNILLVLTLIISILGEYSRVVPNKLCSYGILQSFKSCEQWYTCNCSMVLFINKVWRYVCHQMHHRTTANALQII